ncbi:type I restriction enzyme endonuclease domain-containing protein [uncultured Bilophila sp.]|uniref:type I restriction enzyme endonuclease domain-containing protein n=1 Tax=uncultured Bilophila sp. TaxID=529385 RepID=UPI0034A06964
MGNDGLRENSPRTFDGLKANVSVDWAHRESARAHLRALAKRTVRRYVIPGVTG